MQYLNPKFSMQPPEKLDGLGCPRCALGPKWGEHTPDCAGPNKYSTVFILAEIERLHGVRLERAWVPSDCEFCHMDECGDFEAAGYLQAPDCRAICVRCLDLGRHLRLR